MDESDLMVLTDAERILEGKERRDVQVSVHVPSRSDSSFHFLSSFLPLVLSILSSISLA